MQLRRVLLTGLAWVAALGVGRGVIALPEQCSAVTGTEVRAAAESAVGWFSANQLDDGRWVYRYDREAEAYDRRPHLVRHAGVTMSLYQADASGIPGAREVADRGAAWAIGQMVDAGGGRAIAYDGAVPTGGAALLTAGLAVREATTGDGRFDAELADLGRFLTTMVEPSGAVLANWDLDAGAPVAGRYSTYYTGEALWALSMLATVDPDGGWDEPARRVARYVATEQADAEDLFPPLSDHWAAYGLAQLQTGAGVALDGDERDYAARLAQIFGIQIRYEAQRTNEGVNKELLRGGQVLGAGLGTLGEGLGSLYRLASSPSLAGEAPPGAGDRDVLAERTVCVASLLVDRQVTADEASSGAHPDALEGAWFLGPVTQKDDQQHALSALLLGEAAIERGFATRTSSDDPSVLRVVWLAAIVVAVTSPLRVRTLAAVSGRRPALAGVTVFAAVLVGAALVARPLMRGIDVSPATVLVGAGLLVVISACVDLARPRPAVDLPPWLALLRPAPVLGVLAIAASAGPAVGLVIAVAAAAAVVAFVVAPAVGLSRAVFDTATRGLAALAVLGGIDLLMHGVFSV